jgi:hypothetical protein
MAGSRCKRSFLCNGRLCRRQIAGSLAAKITVQDKTQS